MTSQLFGWAIRVGKVVIDGDGKGVGSKKSAFVWVLTVKARDLEKTGRVFAVVDETINHDGGAHIVSCAHEDGTESNIVKKLGLEVKDGFGASLNGPVHGKHDWLIYKSGVGISQQSEQSDESVE
jgi:hypothetical protein